MTDPTPQRDTSSGDCILCAVSDHVPVVGERVRGRREKPPSSWCSQ